MVVPIFGETNISGFNYQYHEGGIVLDSVLAEPRTTIRSDQRLAVRQLFRQQNMPSDISGSNRSVLGVCDRS